MNNLESVLQGENSDSGLDVHEMLYLVKEGHRLLRTQAIERFDLLQSLASRYKFQNDEITKLLYEEISTLHADTDTLLNQLRILLLNDPQKVELIEMLVGTDAVEDAKANIENPKFQLGSLILKEEANIMAREELLAILQEDLDLNKASRYRLVSEIYELRNQLDSLKIEAENLEKILLYNPRFKIIELLSKHPDGMAIHQITTLVGKSENEVISIIQELEANAFVEVKGILVKQILS